MEYKTLLHVGYHKTGTSFLQKEIFASPNIDYNAIDRDLIIEEIINKHLFFFDADATRQTLQKDFVADKVNVVSMENLIGNPHSGGYNSYDHLQKLKQLFPAAKVLICIREQSSMILSSYKQYITTTGTLRLKNYLKPIEQGSNILPAFDLKHFCYHALIGNYIDAFGKENVLVLPYELLSKNSHEFLKQIFEFSGLKEEDIAKIDSERKRNIATLSLTIKVKRLYNKWFTKTRINPHGWFGLSTKINQPLFKAVTFIESKFGKKFQKKQDNARMQIIKKATKDFYRESNRKTSELINVDLTAYGYMM